MATQRQLAQRLRLHEVAHGVVDIRANHDLARLGLLLEPRRHVHRVARRHRRATKGIAHHDLARLDPDAHLYAVSQPFADGECRSNGSFGVVLVRRRHAEDGHDGVAAELLDCSTACRHFPRAQLEEATDDAAHDLRVERLAHAR